MSAFLIFFLLFCSSSSITVSEFLLNQTNSPGYIPLTDFSMFYWLFPSKSGFAETDPLIIWFEGGPGCSDMMGIFYENGPYRIKHTGTNEIQLELNKYSWTNFANMLFIDQPKGTGLSISDNFDEYEPEVARDFYDFFIAWLDRFPEYKGRRLILTGCSYAGQMLPPIAQYLYDHRTPDINFQQIALGDAFVHYVDFVKTYPKYALDHKLINSSGYASSMVNATKCVEMMKNGTAELEALYVCSQVFYDIAGTVGDPKFNVFDIRLNCTYPPWCYDFSGATEFIKMPMIQAYLNSSNKIANWNICNATVKKELTYHSMLNNKANNLSYLLSQEIQILQYSGIYDFIVDYYGTQDWIAEMNWEYQKTFNSKGYEDLIVQINGTNTVIGKTKSAANLTYQLVNDAGHLAILSQPQYLYEMHKQFIFASNQTYFGEYYECAAYDVCASAYTACQNDRVCSYQITANPCVEQCNVSYQKYFSQQRSYNTTYNDSEEIQAFPNYCNFKECTASWLSKINNTQLTTFHKCAIDYCFNKYDNYTYIAHKFSQLSNCNNDFKICSQDNACAPLLATVNTCLSTNDLVIDPKLHPIEYFKANYNNYWGKLSTCYPDNSNAKYTNVQKCVQNVWLYQQQQDK